MELDVVYMKKILQFGLSIKINLNIGFEFFTLITVKIDWIMIIMFDFVFLITWINIITDNWVQLTRFVLQSFKIEVIVDNGLFFCKEKHLFVCFELTLN